MTHGINCETAKGDLCRCECDGRFHGVQSSIESYVDKIGDDLDCPDCKFNEKTRCTNIGIISALCADVGCEYKMCEPYTYPKKEELKCK